MADYYISSGQVSSGIILNTYDYMCVSSGGTANSTTVDGGWMNVSSGGSADNTTVNSGVLNVGTLWWETVPDRPINDGGTANHITVNSRGSLIVYDGGTANHITVNSTHMTVSSGGTAVSTTLSGHRDEDDDDFDLDGTALFTTITDSARLAVWAHGSAVSTTVDQGGSMNVIGSADGVTVGSCGILNVIEGGIATDVIWTPTEGEITVSNGGTVVFASACTGVYLGQNHHLLSHAEVMNNVDIGGKTMVVMPGGTANSCTVGPDGCVSVWSGASVDHVRVSGGKLVVFSGAAATDIVWTPTEGWIDAYDGAVITYASSYSGVYYGFNGKLLSHTAEMTGKTVSGHDMYVFSGGTAVSTTVTDEGEMYVADGGVAISAVFDDDAWGHVSAGGVIESMTVKDNAEIDVLSGGKVNHSVIDAPSGNLCLSGGIANDTTVLDGDLEVYENGIANNTTVNSDGCLKVSSGGTANSATVNSRGYLRVSRGGKLTGSLEIAAGATVDMYAGSIIDFDISGQTAGSPARVNDLSLLQSTPDFTITVSTSQTAGVYTLAGGAAAFTRTVSIGTDGANYGSLTVNGAALNYGDYTFALTTSDSNLLLTVSGGPEPAAGGIAGDLNADGRADVVMSITEVGHGGEGATGAWLIQENQIPVWGDLSTRNAGWTVFGTGKTVAGKNTDDVYIKSDSNIVGAWTTGDDGKVTGWETIGEFASDAQVLGLGDFNGNGQSDLLLRAANGAVGCFFTNGQGWNYFQSLGDEWKLVAIGDLNGDGRDDVVLKHDAGFAGSWLTQADGTPMWADLDTLPDGFEIVGAGDFNGDGTDDVLLKSGNYYGAWLVNNGNAVGWMGLGDLGNVTVEQIADFNGDGKDDLRIRTAAGDLGAQLVMDADNLVWKYYGSVGSEWSTALAALA